MLSLPQPLAPSQKSPRGDRGGREAACGEAEGAGRSREHRGWPGPDGEAADARGGPRPGMPRALLPRRRPLQVARQSARSPRCTAAGPTPPQLSPQEQNPLSLALWVVPAPAGSWGWGGQRGARLDDNGTSCAVPPQPLPLLRPTQGRQAGHRLTPAWASSAAHSHPQPQRGTSSCGQDPSLGRARRPGVWGCTLGPCPRPDVPGRLLRLRGCSPVPQQLRQGGSEPGPLLRQLPPRCRAGRTTGRGESRLAPGGRRLGPPPTLPARPPCPPHGAPATWPAAGQGGHLAPGGPGRWEEGRRVGASP